MQYRVFGSRTGLRVSELALGTGNFGTAWGHGAEPQDARAMFERFAAAGGNFIDTADGYQFGQSEQLVGELIASERDNFVLATKYALDSIPKSVPARLGNSRKNMVRSLEDSLRRLKTDRIDLYWAHFPDGETPVEEIVRGFDDLVRAGKILYGGLSNFPAWRIARGATIAELRGWSPLAGVQVEYSLAERTADRELLPMAEGLGLGVALWSPLGGGFLTGKYRAGADGGRLAGLKTLVHTESDARKTAVLDTVLAVAREIGATPAQVAIAWLRRRAAASAAALVPIVGPRTPAQLDDYLAALAVTLTEEQAARLAAASDVPLGVPHEQNATIAAKLGAGLLLPALARRLKEMTMSRSIVLTAPVRTAIGTFGGTLKDTTAVDLGAVAIAATVSRAGLKPEEIGTVVMGNVVQAGARMNPGRQAAVRAGLPVTVPAMTVNRVCGSGAQAIVSAAHEIIAGGLDVAVAGGMENMDLAPYLIARGRWGYRMGDGQLYDSMLRDGLNDAFSEQASGWHTEDLVAKYQVSREAQDRWALRTQQRFAAAQAAGKFKDEIAPVTVKGRKGPTVFDTDEHNRPGTTYETLAALKPAFRDGGTITAGNAPGLNSGAAAVVLAEEGWAKARGVAPMARLAGYGIAAVEPGMFGLGPIPAVRQALARAGWTTGDVERIEINEAFATVAIVVAQELGFDPAIVNVEGGAIAHGHPIGATGAILTTRLIHSMRRDRLTRGVVTLCIGGGQGIALALEAVG